MALKSKVTHESANAATDEQLWTDFVASFKSAFTSTTEKIDALVQLNALKMKGGDLDLYIAMFKRLTRKAGLDLNSTETTARFVVGLQKGLKSLIIRRDTLPSTLTEWMGAAQEVYQHRARVRVELLEVEAREQRNAALSLVLRGANAADRRRSHTNSFDRGV